VRTLFGDRLFLGAMLASALTSAVYFAYLAGASFVLQDIYTLTPAAYSVVFGLNAAGFALFGFLAGRVAEHWSERFAFALGLGIIAAGACGLLATALLQLPLPFAIVSFFAVAAGAAAVSPPATSLALGDYPQFAGTASSVLGVTRFAAGGLAAPLVGMAGSMTMVPLGIVTVVSTALAVTAYLWFVRTPTEATGKLRIARNTTAPNRAGQLVAQPVKTTTSRLPPNCDTSGTSRIALPSDARFLHQTTPLL
jgi:DHA1 family bicyclomycin/chloramphenicol resistance-like MFS transporter